MCVSVSLPHSGPLVVLLQWRRNNLKFFHFPKKKLRKKNEKKIEKNRKNFKKIEKKWKKNEKKKNFFLIIRKFTFFFP